MVEMVTPLTNQTLETLADYSSPELMVPELRNDTASAVIAELCSTLQQDGRLTDSAAFYDAVMARELLSPTAIPPGWALPHARLKAFTRLSFALAHSSKPFTWFGDSGARVQTVFLFAVPEMKAKAYLNLIAAIARLSQNAVLLERLRRARDPKIMFDVLGEVSLCQPRLAGVERLHAHAMKAR
jgi:mannitol/fructose-specific phosphotransferase system IIA component (Ntr-type)